MVICAVDDDLKSLDDLIVKIHAAKKDDCTVMGFTSAGAMMEYVGMHTCDVVFIKVEMQTENGLVIAERLKRMYPSINIILEAAYDHYMKNAFELRVSGYLVRPVEASDIEGELEHLRFAWQG